MPADRSAANERSYGAFPFEPVRDLIGILRVMYAEEARHEHPSKRQLTAVKKLADELLAAARAAAAHDPGTAPYERAIVRAEGATRRLDEVLEDRIGGGQTLDDIVRTAGSRVRREWKRYRPSERELRWACGKVRG